MVWRLTLRVFGISHAGGPVDCYRGRDFRGHALLDSLEKARKKVGVDMYYVDRGQIEERMQFLPQISEACRELQNRWDGQDLLTALAQERTLHLAIESVTDIGSLLIDGFLMRDASSYEDIIEILAGERVFSEEVADVLYRLVKMRKPLIQEYMTVSRKELHPMIQELPDSLVDFSRSVGEFMDRELA